MAALSVLAMIGCLRLEPVVDGVHNFVIRRLVLDDAPGVGEVQRNLHLAIPFPKYL